MNKTQRGLLVLVGMIVFAAVFCFWIPFMLLPGAGIAVALPVIYVPGEILIKDFLGEGVHLTNTLVGMLVADLVIVIILLFLIRGGGVKAIPGRLQSILEMIVGFMYDFAKSVAGSRAGRIFPLVMTIFFFLLVANWLELVPGVDSVGLIHCAEDGFAGYPINVAEGEAIEGVVSLRVTSPLDAGTRASEADFCACEAVHLGHFPAGEEAVCEHALEEAGVHLPAGDAHGEGEAADEAHAEEGEAAEEGEYHGVSDELVAAVKEAEEAGLVRSDIFVVTPFVRAAATDLNLTVALAIIAVIMVQVYGVWALGPDYFQKFVNLRALGNLGKKPLGLIDFVVGIFEIVSEFAKIISFAFRLFGNIFAGQVLLFIMAFLVATMLPVVFYALELFVGLMQAFVFAVLTLIFSAQAMESHHHDEEHEGAH
ncbi:MAG: F0F1 ATP synthase subunit A [Anaerolineae bacterium]|nr:F0F1 ATP synthase subunit A [Anaerolineae bacterium]